MNYSPQILGYVYAQGAVCVDCAPKGEIRAVRVPILSGSDSVCDCIQCGDRFIGPITGLDSTTFGGGSASHEY